jgi:diketogulonate reductase-like aldo/keto reductase
VGGVVTTALQIGYRGFDTADMYYTEPLLAEAFGKAFKAGVVRREDLFVTTKLDPFEEDPVASLKKSLRCLPNPYSLCEMRSADACLFLCWYKMRTFSC